MREVMVNGMTNEERARQLVFEWDRDYRWRAEEHSPAAAGVRWPKLQEMIREALDDVALEFMD